MNITRNTDTLNLRLTAVFLVLAVKLLGIAYPLDAQELDRPNILFAIADDWGAHAGAYGTETIETPVFDQVAAQGVLFQRAFVAAPSCTPSRGAILTGQHTWRLGPGANLHGTLPADLPVYPQLLEETGYFTGHTRKGWGPGKLEPGGRKEHPAGPAFKSFAKFLAKRPADVPFVFWFGSQDPHRSYSDSLRKAMGINPADVAVPPYLPDVSTVRRDIANYYAEVQRFDREVGELLEQLEAAGIAENTIVVITGDHGWPFPHGKSNLYDAGTRVPLAIRWPAQIPGGRLVTDLVSLTDLAPTFLDVAGIEPPPQMTGRSLVRILKSGQSGSVRSHRSHVLTAKERHHGLSRPDSSGYPSRAIRTDHFLYIRNFAPARWPAGSPCISSSQEIFSDMDEGITKRWMIAHASDPEVQPLFRLLFGKRPAEELYDLRTDPYQMHNVADDPKYAKIREHLAYVLKQELRAMEDPREIGRAHFDDYPYYVRYGMEVVEPPQSVKEALPLPLNECEYANN